MRFNARVYNLTRKVPKGKVTTYAEIAREMGTRGYRAVGNALNKAEGIPCHRVIRSDGTVGGYAHGTKKKIEMLRKEGIRIVGNKIKDFERVLFRF
jgi:methylated-DNA-[protein]-cysteine S-methyltransferase